MNIKFSYMYRDFSNYKKHNEIVFSNSNNKSIEEVANIIKEHLIDGEWFYASEWKVPDLHFDNWDFEDDHFLHEFHSIEETDEASINNDTIDNFIKIILAAKSYF